MGGGSYSLDSRSTRASSEGYTTKSVSEIFTQKNINNAMDPSGIEVRESRDSEEHPNSLPIIIGLDVTGSMGSIPHQLVRDGLPTLVSTIIQSGEPDPQILFLGIGDHEYDSSPLQVGQFESSDELLDKWLTTVYLEGGGGPNRGESYHLAWYFAAKHTVTDSFEKRNKKGFLFTIGDEPVLNHLSSHSLDTIMGHEHGFGCQCRHSNYDSSQLFDMARETYHVFHVHISHRYRDQDVIDEWKQLMKDNLIVVHSPDEIPNAIAKRINEVSYQEWSDKQPNETVASSDIEEVEYPDSETTIITDENIIVDNEVEPML